MDRGERDATRIIISDLALLDFMRWSARAWAAAPHSGGTAVPVHVTVHHRRSISCLQYGGKSPHAERTLSNQLGRVSIANIGRAPWRNITPIEIVRFRTVCIRSSIWRS